ncbi:hypothetical protein ABPG72_002582 [Tetrahymena utriculariae]
MQLKQNQKHLSSKILTKQNLFTCTYLKNTFFYINEFNQKEVFIQKLSQAIQNPIDVTEQDYSKDYNILKIVRKQFVCYLILHFVELYGKQQISSFYELWNVCFPEERQIKKKLSKYDIKKEKKKPRPYRRKNIQNNCQLASLLPNSLSNNSCLSFSANFNIQNTEPSSTSNYKDIQNLDLQINQNNSFQKKQIDSAILEEDDDEEEEYINLCNEYYQFANQESFCKKEEYSSKQIDSQKNNKQLSVHHISYYNQYQNNDQNQNCNYFQFNGQNNGCLQQDRYYYLPTQYQNQQNNQYQKINTFESINQVKKEKQTDLFIYQKCELF